MIALLYPLFNSGSARRWDGSHSSDACVAYAAYYTPISAQVRIACIVFLLVVCKDENKEGSCAPAPLTADSTVATRMHILATVLVAMARL